MNHSFFARRLELIPFLCFFLFLSNPSSAPCQTQSWHSIEDERDLIETTIISGDYTNGLVRSGSALFTYRNTPAFHDIAESVYRAYSGVSRTEAESLYAFRTSDPKTISSGLGWLETGLLARALEKPQETIVAFQEALKDEQCCQIPLTYTLLAQSYSDVDNASASFFFDEAIRAASDKPEILFQVRQLQARTHFLKGQATPWRECVEACASSSLPMERAWGLEQLAEDAWRIGDAENFSRHIASAINAASPYSATTSYTCKWQHRKWQFLDRHLRHAKAVLAGSTTDGVVFDYETAILDAFRGNLKPALSRMTPWAVNFPIQEVDSWNSDFQYWGQRAHLFYNNLLARLGRYEEAIAGFEQMLLYARDTEQCDFEPHIYCQLGSALKHAGRFYDALEAFETGLSTLDVPGVIADPTVRYYRQGRISKNARMNYVANYRHLLRVIHQQQGG